MQRIANEASVSLETTPLIRGYDKTEISLRAESLQHVIDSLPEQIAVLDISGTILVANGAWKKAVGDHGYPEALPGCNYRKFCADKAVEGYKPASLAVEALDEIAAGNRTFWQLVYSGGERWAGRDFEVSFRRFEMGSQTLIFVARFDLTEILELRRARDDFTQALIEGRAAERRRMTRELHDSTSQVLTSAKLILGRLRHDTAPGDSADLISELHDLVTEAQQEIRSIAFLANPPALQLGLTSALKSLAEGFERRAALETQFEVCGQVESVPQAMDTAFFRVAQEALSNVHRHANARHVKLSLCCRSSATHLIIVDDGVGIARESLGTDVSGVGLASMRCRMMELRGRLTARRLSQGTAIIATVRHC